MFCSNCGSQVTGNFCSNCGARVGDAPSAQPSTPASSAPVSTPPTSVEEVVLWQGKPSGIIDKAKSSANINSVEYKVTNQRIIVSKGLMSHKTEEIELGKVKDYKVTQSFAEKMQNIGNVTVISTDSTAPVITFVNVESPFDVKEIIRSAVVDYRARMGIQFRETL